MSPRGPSEARYDAVVVGSGIGGLTAALTLATRGKSVLVLEAGKQFGGYTNPFRRGKYGFEPGLHYIGECGKGQQLARVLDDLELSDEIRFRELSPGGFDRLAFPGYEVSMPKGADAYRERLARDFPAERPGLDRFFALLHDFREAMRAMNRVRDAASLLRASRHAPFFLRWGRATYAELLAPLLRDPLLRAVLAGQGGDYGLPPSRASALVGLGVLDHYLGGAYFPVGGSRALRDAFVRAIEQRGGRMERNSPVARILVSGGRVRGVRTASGREIAADVVVSNADATTTYRDLVGDSHLPGRVSRKVRSTRHSLGSVCLFIGTDLDVASLGMTDANLWNYPSVDLDAAYRPLARGELPPPDFFFLSSPTLKDPESTDKAPPGHHTLEVVTLAPFEPFARWADTRTSKRGEAYEAFKDRLAERYLESVERYVPGLRGHVKVLELATPLTNASYVAAPRGCIYGPDHTPDQMGPFRFSMRGAVPGLFLCGASTISAGIVPSAISGHVAGRLAARDCEQAAARRTSWLWRLARRLPFLGGDAAPRPRAAHQAE